MTVKISKQDATVAIRAATDPNAIPEPIQVAVNFLYPAAVAIVQDYAPGAPDEVHDVALIRLLGWLFDADPTDSRISRAMQVSGAAPLMSRWRVHRAGAVGVESELPAPPAADLPPAPVGGSWVLISNNGTLAWVKFPLP